MAFFPLLFFIPVFLVIISVMIGARRGRGFANAMLTEPRCAKCNYDLRGFSGAAPVRCSECGSDLTARNAIVWGTFQPKKTRVLIAIAIGVMTPAIILPLLLMHVRSSVVFPGSPGFSARSNAVFIASLATTANQPWDWQEVERRLASGKLSSAEVGQAIDQLIAFLKTQTTSQPLVWCESFLGKADAAGDITDAQYQRLARAFYKTATVSIAGSIRSGRTVMMVVNAGGFSRLPGSQYVFALRQVTAGGKSLTIEHQGYQGQSRAGIQSELDYLSAVSPLNIIGKMKLDVPAGDYVLSFTVDVGVLRDKTAPQLGGNFPGQSSGWPRGRASWTDVVTVPVHVVPADQSPIAQITDPSLNPLSLGEIKVKSIRVTRAGAGKHAAVDLAIDVGRMPCSFDAFLRIAGQEYSLGQAVGYSGYAVDVEHGCDLDSLDASIQTADLLLRPNAKHIEGTPGVDRIWGSSVELLNIPLQRFDVPGR